MIQRFLWGLRHARLGGDRGIKRFVDCTSELPPTPMEEDDMETHPVQEAASVAPGAVEEAATEMPMTQVPNVSDGAPMAVHKRSDAGEEDQQQKERKLEGRVKQEVTRIEKQTRAREDSTEGPPKQRPRVVQDGSPSRTA
eukprot:3010261-Amphidinium_carterae.1